jgi:hypothetical protein
MFNQALLARKAWRLLTNPDSLCARVLKAKYYPNGRLEDTVFSGNASSTWTAIAYGLELLKKGLIWHIGNGQSIRIWRDQWIPRPVSYKPVSAKRRCRLRFVSELIDQHGEWKEDLLNQYFIPMDVVEILKFKPSPRLLPDHLAWAPQKHGLFTVRSAYGLAMNESSRSSTQVVQFLMEIGKSGTLFGRVMLHQKFNILLGVLSQTRSQPGGINISEHWK